MSNQNFILILSGIIGVISGLAAVILKQGVHAIQNFLTEGFYVEYANFMYIIYPIIGIAAAFLIGKYLFKDVGGHGIPDVLFTISKKQSLIPRVKTYSRVFRFWRFRRIRSTHAGNRVSHWFQYWSFGTSQLQKKNFIDWLWSCWCDIGHIWSADRSRDFCDRGHINGNQYGKLYPFADCLGDGLPDFHVVDWGGFSLQFQSSGRI